MIRKARVTDCKNLAALSIQVWLNTYARDGLNDVVTDYVLNTFTQQYFKEKLSQPSYQLYVYVENDHLLGFVAVDLCSFCKGDVGGKNSGYEVETLYVQNRQQGKGVGRALLEYISAQHDDCYWLTTWVGNVEGLGFYRHIGFEDIGVSYFELDGQQHENRVLMYKEKFAQALPAEVL